MAANPTIAARAVTNGGLRFKEGPYLTPKVERIMLQIARGRSVPWIAKLYDVREPFVYYVARKTGFPASVLAANGNGSKDRKDRGGEAW